MSEFKDSGIADKIGIIIFVFVFVFLALLSVVGIILGIAKFI